MHHNIHPLSGPASGIFFRQPQPFTKASPPEHLRYCLGGTLYMPSTRAVMDKIISGEMPNIRSMVMCFEDAIRPEDLPKGEQNVLDQLAYLAAKIKDHSLDPDDVPLIFLRVRNMDQFTRFSARLTAPLANVLTGFVFPKFYSDNAHLYLGHLVALNERLQTRLYGMPILEGAAIIHLETRAEELHRLAQITRTYRDHILNIRVGGTDFSSFFGVRRSIGSSIYDILPVRDALADILNVFGRAEDGYVISAAVWEYFRAYKRDDLEKVMQANITQSLRTMTPILNDAIDGLLREVLLDKANGFIGKTVIHPSHLPYVNAMQAVTREEYEDACQILDTAGGVIKSSNNNKMNEINPHKNWATRIKRLANAYGVLNDETHYTTLFKAGSTAT